MDTDLDFCLKRFADEQMTNSIKQSDQLERNLRRKRTKIQETVQQDDPVICQQENKLAQQFSDDLNENNMAINKTRQIIEDLFQEALDDIRNDINTIVQISLTRNNNQQNNEEIRTASNKIRQQIARIDSEVTQIFNMIDYNNSMNCSSRIISWFRQHYGYANELNRMVGKNTSSGDLLAFSENSPLMQCILDRARLWYSRQKLITEFTHQMDEDSVTSKHLFDSLYRMTNTFSTHKFIHCFIQHRQEGRRHRDEQALRKMETELVERHMEQQTRAIELVNALCQLSVSFENEFQLNKKLKMVLHQSEVSKQVVPILIDHNEETAPVEDLSLIIRLEDGYNKWTSNACSIQQRFCVALCKTLQLPTDSLKIERVEEGSVILYILISSPYGQSVIKQISECRRDNESSMTNVQAIQKCCAKFDSRIYSIVAGKNTLPIEKCLMDLKMNKMYVNNSESIDNTYWLNSFDREDKQSLCPEGWKRFGIKVVDNDAIFDAKWGSWHIVYHGTQSPHAPFILTSGLRVTTQQYCMPENHQTICLSPSIEYSAHPRYTRPWKKITDDGGKYRYYQLVFQCRVNPDAVGSLKPETLLHEEYKTMRIDKKFPNEELEWVITGDNITRDYIRKNIVCYGLMVRMIDGEPKDLAASRWWIYSHYAEY